MALTSQLGTVDSSLGNIALGLGAVTHAEYLLSAENFLGLSDQARIPEKDLAAENGVQFSNSVVANLKGVTASDSIEFTHTATTPRPIRITVVNSLLALDGLQPGQVGFRNEAVLTYSRAFSANSTASFADTASVTKVRADGTSVSADNTLSLTHAAATNVTGDAADTLTLTHSADVTVSTPTVNTVGFSNEAALAKTTGRLAVNALVMDQSVAVLLNKPNIECEYSGVRPLRGHTSETFQLVYPPDGPYTEIVRLRAPNLGNRERIGLTRIQRETRGGTLHVFSDPIWPKTKTLVVQFSVLKLSEAEALNTFYSAHLGQEVGMMDWEGVYWVGVITEFDPLVADRDDSYTVGFHIECEESAWLHDISNQLQLTSSATGVL